MNELTVWLSDEEVGVIANELSRLFLFQDRPFGKDKQVAFLDDIRGWGLPSGAIILGLRKLMAEDLKSLRLATIKDAAMEFVHHESVEKKNCEYCEKRGVVFMRDDAHYEFSFACPCINGDRFRIAHRLVTWNGDAVQLHRGKKFHLRFADSLLSKKS